MTSVSVLVAGNCCHYEIGFETFLKNDLKQEASIKGLDAIKKAPDLKLLTADAPEPRKGPQKTGSHGLYLDYFMAIQNSSVFEPGFLPNDKEGSTEQDHGIIGQEVEIDEDEEGNGKEGQTEPAVVTEEEQEITEEENIAQEETEQSENIQVATGSDPEIRVFDMLNHIRVSNGLAPFSLNPSLTSVARYRAQDMIARDYFSHVTPEGKSIYDVLAEHGVAFAQAGENIQYCSPPGWKSLEGFIDTWMASSGHRANILNGGFSQLGVGIVDADNKRMAVVIFLN